MIAVLLQAGLVAIFIYSLPLIVSVKRLPHEITFLLPPLREAVRPDTRARRGRLSPSRPLTPPPLTMPPIVMPPVAPPSASDLQGFGNALFGCAPENLGKLTPEQRSHCSGLAAIPRDKDSVGEPHSLVKDLPRREAELAARNTPARVHCVELRTRTLGFNGIQDTGIMTDPLCALNGWINGFAGLPP
jgi:hypothetical protein